MSRGEQEGVLRLKGADGESREVEFTAKGNVLPVLHVLILQDKPVVAAADSPTPGARRIPDGSATMRFPAGFGR